MPINMPYRRYARRTRRPRTMGRGRGNYRTQRYRRRPMISGAVKRIIDAELKFTDLDVGPVAIPTVVGFLSPISEPVGQGTLATQRIGNWIKPVTWYGMITVTGDPAEADSTSLIRLMAIQWLEDETQNPISLEDIVQDTAEPHQGFNIQNKGQFKILWSRTAIISNNNDNPQFQKMFKFYVKPRMKVLYDAAAAKKGQLFLLAFSNIPVGGSPPQYEFSSRLRYTDS